MRPAAQIAVLAVALSTPVSASAAILDCVGLDAVALNEEGLMSQTPIAKYELGRHAKFTADPATGTIAGPELKRQVWAIADEGSRSDDTVLVATDAPDAATDDFFRFRAWSVANENPTVRFLRFFNGTVITGTCAPAR